MCPTAPRRAAARALLLPALLLPALAARAEPPRGAASAAGSSPAALVREVADAYVAESIRRSPHLAEQVGASTPVDRWTDNTSAALRAWEARQDVFLAQLSSVDAAALQGTPEWLVHGMLREALEAERAQRVCRLELWRGVDQIFGWHLGLTQAAAEQPVGTKAARAQALARWRALPGFVRTELANAREGLARGYSVPRPNVERVIQQLEGMLAQAPERSPLWSPAERSGSPAFQKQWAAVLRGAVFPALGRYRDFLKKEYLPRARLESGLSALPEGAACYRAIVRAYSSLDVSPEELRERAREARKGLEAELAPLVRRLTGLEDLREGRRALATDARFAFGSREAKVEQTRAELERVRGLVPRAFSRIPETPVVLEVAPPFREQSSPPAWYEPAPLDGSRAATYFLNLGGAETSPRMGLAASVAHEAWPGHHLQIAWLRERSVAHPVLRLLSTAAFVEGWGMYAERVAFETGMFEDELLRAGLLGHLTDALVGLELDPGMHVFGVTREQAVQTMMTVSSRPRAEAERYADRHASTPGQLVTYMTGYLELMRLREEARRALGERFDLRDFHDVVLGDGPLPLPLLRQKLERWVAAKKA
jgi:uncharacterized protein (DUF885 family)